MEIGCLSRLDTVTRNYIQPLKLQAMSSLKRVKLAECSLQGIGLHTESSHNFKRSQWPAVKNLLCVFVAETGMMA